MTNSAEHYIISKTLSAVPTYICPVSYTHLDVYKRQLQMSLNNVEDLL